MSKRVKITFESINKGKYEILKVSRGGKEIDSNKKGHIIIGEIKPKIKL
jgi:hypothetical protein